MPAVLTPVHQGLLYEAVQVLFPGIDIPINARKLASIKDSRTGKYKEIDIWIPDHGIGFEFQDTYHYITTWYSQVPLEDIQQADKAKVGQAGHMALTLIVVPCWWNGSCESLAASIYFARPDLQNCTSSSEPISLNPPFNHFELPQVPDIGELMLASYPVDGKLSISADRPWWMGEKYDGIRCCWHPTRNVLYSRSGLELEILPSMNSWLPSMFLDGEIWFGRGQFYEAQRLVTSLIDQINWPYIRLLAFDAPCSMSSDDNGSVFEDRYRSLVTLIRDNPFSILAPRRQCSNRIQIISATNSIIKYGGEGIILRAPNSLYESGRSSSLVKLKASFEDREALVTRVFENNDLELKLVDDSIVIVPCKNVELSTKPQQGDIVSFFFNNNTRKLASNMLVYRIRADVAWEEVLASSVSSDLVKLNDSSKLTTQTTNHHPYYNLFQMSVYWKEVSNRREWFKNFANLKGFDPLVADNWYSVAFNATPEFKAILWHYSGKIEKALLHLFPEIGLKEHMISKANFWLHTHNRTQFFVDLARRHGFDPLIPDNWYWISQSDIVHLSGGAAILNYYSGSYKRALMHLFPQIGLEESSFSNTSKNHWVSLANRRKFFEEYAGECGFDPLQASNWYSVLQPSILAKKGGRGLLRFYPGHSFKLALNHLFPDIRLDLMAFSKTPKNHWSKSSNRKAFFEQLAASHAFDPLAPVSWYHLRPQLVLQAKGGKSVLKYYNNSYRRALMQLFPSIGLEANKFIHARH